MRIKISKTLLIIATMLFGSLGIVSAKDDPRNGVSKVTITNQTPYSFKFGFTGKKLPNETVKDDLDQQIVVVDLVPNAKKVVAKPGYIFAYEDSIFYFSINLKRNTMGQESFKETLSWGSKKLIEEGFAFYGEGFGDYSGDGDEFRDEYISVLVSFKFINEDDLQVEILEFQSQN